MTDFDPFARAQDIREHPENYVSLQHCMEIAQARIAIRRAKSLEEINKVFQPAAKKARAENDEELLGWLTEAAQKRKAEI